MIMITTTITTIMTIMTIMDMVTDMVIAMPQRISVEPSPLAWG